MVCILVFVTLNRDWHPRLSLWGLGLDPGYMEGSESGQIALIIRQACEFPELECFNPTGQPYMTVLLVVSLPFLWHTYVTSFL